MGRWINAQDCFTQSNFFQLRFRRRLRLLLSTPGLDLVRGSTVPASLIACLSNSDGRRGGSVALKASSGERWERAALLDDDGISRGNVDERFNRLGAPSLSPFIDCAGVILAVVRPGVKLVLIFLLFAFQPLSIYDCQCTFKIHKWYIHKWYRFLTIYRLLLKPGGGRVDLGISLGKVKCAFLVE